MAENITLKVRGTLWSLRQFLYPQSLGLGRLFWDWRLAEMN